MVRCFRVRVMVKGMVRVTVKAVKARVRVMKL